MKKRTAFMIAAGIGGAALLLNRCMGSPDELYYSVADEPFLYDKNDRLLGIVSSGSCVIIGRHDPVKEGYVYVTVPTDKNGLLEGMIARRLLRTPVPAFTRETCKADYRQVMKQPGADQGFAANLPEAETYKVTRKTQLFPSPQGTAVNGFFAEPGSCLSVLFKGAHTADRLAVNASNDGTSVIGHVEKKDIAPLGPYDWKNGCNAVISKAPAP